MQLILMYYNAANYWTPGWTYPRERLREPFPRRGRQALAALVAPPFLSAGTPERWFESPPREEYFVALARGETFVAAVRGEVFDSGRSST
jgi:hypothetical protein